MSVRSNTLPSVMRAAVIRADKIVVDSNVPVPLISEDHLLVIDK